MKVNLYLINHTYVAEDSGTGIIAYGSTEDKAREALVVELEKYWATEKTIVPVNHEKDRSTPPSGLSGTKEDKK